MFGLINDSDRLIGFQIGVINIARNASFPFTLFFNVNYNENTKMQATGIVTSTWSLIQLSFYVPGQIFTYQTPIFGLRFNPIYGSNISVHGIDVGLYNRSSKKAGLEIGGFNYIEGNAYGFIVGNYNNVVGDFYVVQLGLPVSYNQKSIYGLSIALVTSFDKSISLHPPINSTPLSILSGHL